MLLLGLAGGFLLRGGDWLLAEDAEFRLVRTATGVYAFDRGQLPEIDGVEYIDPLAAAEHFERLRTRGRSSISDRNAIPNRRRADAPPIAEEFGRIRWESEAYELPVLGPIAFVERITPEIKMYEGRRDTEGDPVRYQPPPPGPDVLPIIADYFDRCYPGSGYGDRVRSGLRTRLRVPNGSWPGLLLTVSSIAAGGLLVALPRRRARAKQTGPAPADRPV